jgi:Flp pilus assembly protein TadG
MLPPLIQRPGRIAASRPRERGVTLLLVAVAMFSVIAMAALSIDVGTLYEASAEAQRAADAAALAAARVLSSSGMTGDPANSATKWTSICTNATQVAQAVAGQNNVGGAPLLTVNVNVSFFASDKTDCGSTGGGFGVNPMVTVKVTQSSLGTYFSRIWGRAGSSVSATATAEAFNPSNSGSYASNGMVPVQPRCVKPWIVPNYDPLNPSPPPYCTNTGPPFCKPLVSTADGSIVNPGLYADGHVIGESFWLVADCVFKQATCVFRSGTKDNPWIPPQVNASNAAHPHAQGPPNLHYLPGQTSFDSAAVPSDGSDACSASAAPDTYAEAVAGCDQSTQYQCGKSWKNAVDLNENPGKADTTNGVECLIHSSNGNTGQDMLKPSTSLPGSPLYPFQIEIGSGNPLNNVSGVSSGDAITSSTSIVSLPIYDSTAVTDFSSGGTVSVTIVGFLQVFIKQVDGYGNVEVTVMNVAGCGNGVSSGTVELQGTSPVPVRLITPQ